MRAAFALRDKLTATILPPLHSTYTALSDTVRGHWYNSTDGQRRVALAGAALVVIAAVALIAYSGSSPKNTGLKIAAPPPPTRVTLSVPQRPSADAPAPIAPIAEETMSVPLAETLRALQNTPVQLSAAPIDALSVATPDGNLPRIGADGRLPWQAYARPTPAVPAGTPRLAVMMVDMGLSERLTGPALEQLPGQVSVAFSGHTPKLAEYITGARTRGHEVIIDIPAEPRYYPEEDPGPTALMTRIGSDQNTKRLREWLAKAPGAIGVTTLSGTQFVTDAAAMTPVINELRLRGLAWLGAGIDTGAVKSRGAQLANTLQAAYTSADVDLDSILTPSHIREQFTKAVALAREQQSALIIARPYPLTVSLLNELLAGLPDAGIALVPASALLVAPINTPAMTPATPAVTPAADVPAEETPTEEPTGEEPTGEPSDE